jgi:UDP-N-acetylglucosamine:LPS N-acetylglucosamine transferase
MDFLKKSHPDRQTEMSKSIPKLFAVASGGGHWRQLMLLSPAFSGFDVIFISTNGDFIDTEQCPNFRIISDSNRNNPLLALKCASQCLALVRSERPDAIVSTGALPGLILLLAGRLLGVRTMWLESLANAEQPSLCGKVARYFVDHWLTQWEHLARPGHREYEGALL